jgi:hypothetical protein
LIGEQFDKSPLAPLFQRGESIPGDAKENKSDNLALKKAKRFENNITKSMLSIKVQIILANNSLLFFETCSQPVPDRQ